jgi:predicted nicotinamide N-methyase
LADRYTDFIRANTAVENPPLIPEIALHLATEIVPIWQATEEELADMGLPPPYWAFAWAGGQGLARHILDSPEIVAGKTVLDFASGSGLVAIAAMKAGAARAIAADIDPYAEAAALLNAALNGVAVEAVSENLIGTAGPWDVVLAGDICYEQPLAERVTAWLRGLSGSGTTVLMGDPGRTYLPKDGLEWVVRYAVKTTRELEDTDMRNAVVWRFA